MTEITTNKISWLRTGSPGHSIFSDPPKAPPKPKYVLAATRTLPEEEETSPKREIATRGTEVFVAAGCEVRCVDLRDLKARDEDEEATVGGKGKQRAEMVKGYQVRLLPANSHSRDERRSNHGE